MSHRMVSLLFVILGALALGTPSARAQNYLEVDPFDSSINAIEYAIKPTADGSNHAILLALRQLKDPAMRPLFQRLVSSKEPTLQIDALLALAEVGDGPIDPFLLKRLQPRERMIALAAAINLELLDKESIETILESKDLTAVELIILYAAGSDYGVAIDKDRIAPLLEDPDVVTRINAGILLASTGDTAAGARAVEEYALLDTRNKEVVAAALADIGSWHPMPEAIDVFALAMQEENLARSVHLAIVDAALGCECPEGLELWHEAARNALTSGDRLRYGTMALGHGIKTENWDVIRDDRKTNQVIADAGEAFARGTNVPSAADALIAVKHPLLLEAAVALSNNVSQEERLSIQRAIIEAARTDPRLLPISVQCFTKIGNEHPAELPGLLEETLSAENPRFKEAAMIGILNSDQPEVRRQALPFCTSENRTVRSIALLALTHGGAKLDDKELEELATVASGGGRVDPTMRAVAAWLWLKQTGSQERALARIVGET